MVVTKSDRDVWLRRAAQAWLTLVVLTVIGIVIAANGWAGVFGIGAVVGIVGSIVSLMYLLDF